MEQSVYLALTQQAVVHIGISQIRLYGMPVDTVFLRMSEILNVNILLSFFQKKINTVPAA